MHVSAMNLSARSLDEEDATAVTVWEMSEASRRVGSFRRSRTKTVHVIHSSARRALSSMGSLKHVPSAIHPVAILIQKKNSWSAQECSAGKLDHIPIIPHRTLYSAMVTVWGIKYDRKRYIGRVAQTGDKRRRGKR